MSRLATLLKQHLRLLKTSLRILFRNEIGTHREHDSEGVCIWLNVWLRVQPVESTKRHNKSLFAVNIMLGKSTCIHDSIGRVDIWLDIRILGCVVHAPKII